MAVKITNENAPSDRYRYDFQYCSARQGWAQIDTAGDAWYLGNWANPTTRMLFSYCEGDTSLTECDTDAEFVEQVRGVAECYGEGFKGIDPMCVPEIEAAFRRLGLADLFHSTSTRTVSEDYAA